jgi:hypothetical protein
MANILRWKEVCLKLLIKLYRIISGNNIPRKIQEVRWEFKIDFNKLWGFDVPVTKVNIKDLVWHFDYPFWDEIVDDWNLTPWEVIKDPNLHKNHYKKVLESNLKYPIDLMENEGRLQILDGLHRLAKAYLKGDKFIKARIVPKDKIKDIANPIA